MGRQLRIVHHTGYRYPSGVAASRNEARMTPRTNREQIVLATTLEISPTAWTYGYRDYWGTQVTAFEISAPHDRLQVVATSTVEVGDRPATGLGISWEEVLDPELADQYVEMLQLAGHIEPPAGLRTLARRIRRDAPTPAQAVHRLVTAIRERVDYVPGSTEVHTRASEVWEARAGVCQDLVHLALGALRSIGVPARYVSGYVMPSQNPSVGEPQTGESHAWLQYWDGRWVGLDPTNDTAPGDFHVEIGTGRDYFDIPPLKGVYSGPSESDMFVEVEITVLA
ncbi:MAG: transglutaminase family protein [Propionicimonas sp.]|uniref:transglutaminase family protein n=1 Tax=Propionicimonas sp. TaxID=1955623 RepID=UPI002B20E900|nr:transglutaminase family protein [Propionicimonas sp.]MEA4942865.1 transglutaminase family protein [Propionicimonas sp.]